MEAVTADEKETDIRLRSTSSRLQQGTIELKLGDDRSANDLFNTIKGSATNKNIWPNRQVRRPPR